MNKLQQLLSKITKNIFSYAKWVILIVLLVAIVSVVGYYGYNKYQSDYYRDPEITKLTDEQIKNIEVRKQELLIVLKEFPDYFEVYLELGQIEKNLGNYQQAFKYNKLASKIIPTSSAPYMNMGIYSVELGHYDAAEKYFSKAIKTTPDYYLAYQKLADLYRNYYKNKKAETVAVYESGIEATNSEDLVREFADYLNKNGEKEEALKYYKQLEQASPEDEAIRKMNEEVEKSLKENPQALD